AARWRSALAWPADRSARAAARSKPSRRCSATVNRCSTTSAVRSRFTPTTLRRERRSRREALCRGSCGGRPASGVTTAPTEPAPLVVREPTPDAVLLAAPQRPLEALRAHRAPGADELGRPRFRVRRREEDVGIHALAGGLVTPRCLQLVCAFPHRSDASTNDPGRVGIPPAVPEERPFGSGPA